MSQTTRRVLFLDGIGCNPDGFKPRYMRELGYEVLAPMLNDRDFPESVSLAEAAVRDFQPDVIVGYSRGGSVALAITDQTIPRLLIAPALHWIVDSVRFTGYMTVLHSATDDGLPLEQVKDQLARCCQGPVTLQIVGEDHTMIDTEALQALESGLREATRKA